MLKSRSRATQPVVTEYFLQKQRNPQYLTDRILSCVYNYNIFDTDIKHQDIGKLYKIHRNLHKNIHVATTYVV